MSDTQQVHGEAETITSSLKAKNGLIEERLVSRGGDPQSLNLQGG